MLEQHGQPSISEARRNRLIRLLGSLEQARTRAQAANLDTTALLVQVAILDVLEVLSSHRQLRQGPARRRHK